MTQKLIILRGPRNLSNNIRINNLLCAIKDDDKKDLVLENWPKNPLLKLVAIARHTITALIKTKRDDIIFATAPVVYSSIPALITKFLKGNKLIVDYDDSFRDISKHKPTITQINFWEWMSIKNADKVVAISHKLKDIASEIRRDDKDIIYIPNLVDTSRFDPSKFDRRVLRKKYGFSEDDFIVIFVCSIGRFKDYFIGKEIAEASKRLVQEKILGKHLKFVIVGGGAGLDLFRRYVHENGLDDHYEFTGFVDHYEVIKYIAIADICLDAFTEKGFNMQCRSSCKMKEYMSMSKTVIAPRIGENIYDLNNGKLGFLIEYTPENIVRTIKKVSTPKFNKKISNLAREKVINTYDCYTNSLRLKEFINFNT